MTTAPANFQQGQAALMSVLMVIALTLVILLGVNLLAVISRQNLRREINSLQSYFLAESGIEDSLLRITRQDMSYSANNSLTLDGHTATISIEQTGQKLTVTSGGSVASQVRTVSTTMQKNTTEANFFYGVQVGEGGLEIRHNQGQVIGNVFSNGTAFGAGEITGSVTVAGAGNELQDLDVGENAFAYACADADISGDLEYHESGTSNCAVGGATSTAGETIAPIDFPITAQNIADWQADAEAGGVLSGNQVIGEDQTLGPVKIDGDLFIKNNVTVTLTGNVWITGSYDNGNNAVVEVAESYGENSGIFIADGNLQLRNNVIMRGTSHPDSYLLVIGNSSSENEASAAIDVKNNLAGAILFAAQGLMVIHNNVELVEAMAHKLLIHKATITYESGLENVSFASGPSGGWDFSAWFEIE